MYDARTLHVWLGVLDPFSQWMRRRLKEYGFEQGADFFTVSLKNAGRGRPRTEYLLTRDMAKELAMVENTEIGRKTRRYFIQMEAAAVAMAETLVLNGQAGAIPQGFFDARAEMAETQCASD